MLSAPKISGILCTSQSVMIWRLSSSEDNEKEKKKRQKLEMTHWDWTIRILSWKVFCELNYDLSNCGLARGQL